MTEARIPFMPPLNSLWVLVNDWRPPSSCITRYQNDTFKDSFGVLGFGDWPPYKANSVGWQWTDEKHAEYKAWQEEQRQQANAVVPTGTVISFNRYHASNSGDVEMTLQFYRSPDPRLTPKKRGGKGKGAMRFYVNLDEFNSLGEMEPFDDGPP